MKKGGKEFRLRREADETCAVVFNENQFLVIGGFSDKSDYRGILVGHHGKVDR